MSDELDLIEQVRQRAVVCAKGPRQRELVEELLSTGFIESTETQIGWNPWNGGLEVSWGTSKATPQSWFGLRTRLRKSGFTLRPSEGSMGTNRRYTMKYVGTKTQ